MTDAVDPAPELSFGQAFDQLRKARGISQAEVARELHVHRGEVSRWIAGGGISITNVRKAATFFGVDRVWLERLAGYDKSVPSPADHDLEAHLEVMGSLLRGIPRVYWGTVIKAMTGLAEALPTQVDAIDVTTPVSEFGQTTVSDAGVGANEGFKDPEPPLSFSKAGSFMHPRELVMAVSSVTATVSV